MPSNDQFVRFLAAWALVHESADEGWKAAVERGASQESGTMADGPDAFVNGLSALVAAEKDRLKSELAQGHAGSTDPHADIGTHLDEVRFEIAELRGRLESMQASLDALLRRSES